MAEETKEGAELRQMQARAVAAREMRRKAPEISVSGKVSVPQKEIINRISKKEGGQDGKWHYSFQDRRNVDALIDRGYEPAINPDTKKWEHYLGDPLMKLPTKDFEQILEENSAASRSMLGQAMKADAAKTGEKVTVSKVDM